MNDQSLQLLMCVQKGEVNGVIKLLNASTFNVNDLKQKNYAGKTVLHYAARYGLIEIASSLLEKGADINLKSDSGDTALDDALLADATETENATMVGFLLGQSTIILDKKRLLLNIKQGYPAEGNIRKNVTKHSLKIVLRHIGISEDAQSSPELLSYLLTYEDASLLVEAVIAGFNIRSDQETFKRIIGDYYGDTVRALAIVRKLCTVQHHLTRELQMICRAFGEVLDDQNAWDLLKRIPCSVDQLKDVSWLGASQAYFCLEGLKREHNFPLELRRLVKDMFQAARYDFLSLFIQNRFTQDWTADWRLRVFQAVRENNVKLLKQFVHHPDFKFEMRNENRQTLVETACLHSEATTIQWLLKEGVDIGDLAHQPSVFAWCLQHESESLLMDLVNAGLDIKTNVLDIYTSVLASEQDELYAQRLMDRLLHRQQQLRQALGFIISSVVSDFEAAAMLRLLPKLQHFVARKTVGELSSIKQMEDYVSNQAKSDNVFTGLQYRLGWPSEIILKLTHYLREQDCVACLLSEEYKVSAALIEKLYQNFQSPDSKIVLFNQARFAPN